MSHSTQSANAAARLRLQVDYIDADDPRPLLAEAGVLAVFGFGDGAPACTDPRYLRIRLQPHGRAPLEVWRTGNTIAYGRDEDIAWASDGGLTFGVIEVDEHQRGIIDAAAHAYRRLTAFTAAGDTPHLLRTWNYLDAITAGPGDDERYRQFCIGRARGLGRIAAGRLPAATAIGRRDGRRILQVYWLAARSPGAPLENPRQISAYRYPRQYGPQPPSFARAMLPPAGARMPLLLSGTASVVGHATAHVGQPLAQLDETFRNFDALIAAARRHAPRLPARFDASSRLKVYVRDATDLETIDQALSARLDDQTPRLLLHATICRRELAVEIDGVHG